jgi:hypothetical protein
MAHIIRAEGVRRLPDLGCGTYYGHAVAVGVLGMLLIEIASEGAGYVSA